MRSIHEEKQTRDERVQDLANALLERRMTVGFVESCTGGALSSACTRMAGSSAWFAGGVVSYSNEVKESIGVSEVTLRDYGAVSEQVAIEMAGAGRRWLGVDVSIAITGIAGPEGGSPEKPVGTVCFAFAISEQLNSCTVQFSGSRHEVQSQAVDYAFNKITRLLKE